MKRTVIGGFITLVGSVWALLILSFASSNIPNEWNPNYGRLFTVVVNYKLMFPFVLSVIVTVLGLALLLIEFFRKEK